MTSNLEKPPYGDKCNNCGQCCEDQICPLARAVFPQWRAPCPALACGPDFSKGCGLINEPARYAPRAILLNYPIMNDGGEIEARRHREALSRAAAILCGAGIGCDAIKSDEVLPPATRRRMMLAAVNAFSKAEITNAKRVWGLET